MYISGPMKKFFILHSPSSHKKKKVSMAESGLAPSTLAEYNKALQETFPSLDLSDTNHVLQALDKIDTNEWHGSELEKQQLIRATTLCYGGTVTFPLLSQGHNLFRVRTRYPKDHPPVTFYKLCIAMPIVKLFADTLHQYATVRFAGSMYQIPDNDIILKEITTSNFANYLKNTKALLDNNFYKLGEESNFWFNVKVTKIVEEMLNKNNNKRPVSGTLRFCFWKNEKEKRICFSVLEYTPVYEREEAAILFCEAAKKRQKQIESEQFGQTWMEKASMEVDVVNGDQGAASDSTLVESDSKE